MVKAIIIIGLLVIAIAYLVYSVIDLNKARKELKKKKEEEQGEDNGVSKS